MYHIMKVFTLLFYLCGCPNVLCSTAFSISSVASPYYDCNAARLHLKDKTNQNHLFQPTDPLSIRGGATEADVAVEHNKGGSPLLSFLAPTTVALDTIGRFYATSLNNRPIVTKSVTAGVTFFLSDYFAQHLEKKGNEDTKQWRYSWKRYFTSSSWYFKPNFFQYAESNHRIQSVTELLCLQQSVCYTLGLQVGLFENWFDYVCMQMISMSISFS